MRICSLRFVALPDERRGTRDTRLRYVDLKEPLARRGLRLATTREKRRDALKIIFEQRLPRFVRIILQYNIIRPPAARMRRVRAHPLGPCCYYCRCRCCFFLFFFVSLPLVFFPSFATPCIATRDATATPRAHFCPAEFVYE